MTIGSLACLSRSVTDPPPDEAPAPPGTRSMASTAVAINASTRRCCNLDIARDLPEGSTSGLLGVEHPRQVVDGRVAGAERGQMVAALDGGQDRGGVVLGVVDHEVVAQAR